MGVVETSGPAMPTDHTAGTAGPPRTIPGGAAAARTRAPQPPRAHSAPLGPGGGGKELGLGPGGRDRRTKLRGGRGSAACGSTSPRCGYLLVHDVDPPTPAGTIGPAGHG